MSKTGCNQAFPVPPETWVGDRGYSYPQEGITKRELFSAMALQGMLANQDISHDWKGLQAEAVRQADGLLDELEKKD